MPWQEDLKFPRGYQMGTHNNYSFFGFFPSNVIQLSRNILNFSWINGINSIYLEFIGLLCVAILLFFLVCRKNRKEI